MSADNKPKKQKSNGAFVRTPKQGRAAKRKSKSKK